MRVWLDATACRLRPDRAGVEDAIRRQNVELPAGRIENPRARVRRRGATDLARPEQFGAIVLRQGDTADAYPVRIRDVGRWRWHRGERTSVRFMGRPAVSIGLIKQSVANPLDLKRGLDEMMPRLQASCPKACR